MTSTLAESQAEFALAPNSQTILTVQELSSKARNLLENQLGTVFIEGEISNLARPPSGHIYLTLKDDQAQIKAAFFKQSQKNLQLDLKDGQKVLVKAKVSLYVPRGDYQLIIQNIEAAGAGQLQQAFEALKLKLEQAGLFNPAAKQTLPPIPQTIGIVTSASGAALQDILHVLNRRFPVAKVIVYPTLVQGQAAAKAIATAIETANLRQEVELLIVGRGGGSLEDLWPFNEEIVAWAIFNSTLPTISAIGHQTDFTIADFVADVRAPTPSVAAELSVPDQNQLYSLFTGFQQRLTEQALQLIKVYQQQLNALSRHIRHPAQQIQEQAQRLDELEQRLQRAHARALQERQQRVQLLGQRLLQQNPHKDIVRQQQIIQRQQKLIQLFVFRALKEKRLALENLYQRLTGVSPDKTLERGYVIVMNEAGIVIDRASQTQTNDSLTLKFIDHTIAVKVV